MLAISQACNPGTDAEAGSLGYVLSSRLARKGPVSLPTYEVGGILQTGKPYLGFQYWGKYSSGWRGCLWLS